VILKHFRKLNRPFTDEEFAALRAELAANAPLWARDQSRQQRIKVHAQTETIFLRNSVGGGVNSDKPFTEVQESEETEMTPRFPLAMDMLRRMAAQERGALSRAMYVRLLPFSEVLSHIDKGAYYEVRDRYHLIVDSDVGSVMCAGPEIVVMKQGEFWWFDNKAMHSSRNPSGKFRTHLIFDLKPVDAN
jgi:hypothetical protein